MGRSPGFASTTHDQYFRRNTYALLRLGFPEASVRKTLTGPYTVTRRIIMQKARRHTLLKAIVLRPLVGVWFQVLLTPLAGVLFIIQSPY